MALRNHPRWADGWGALFIFYSSMDNEEGMDVALENAKKYFDHDAEKIDALLQTKDLVWSSEFCSENIYTRVACMFVKMRLFKVIIKLGVL